MYSIIMGKDQGGRMRNFIADCRNKQIMQILIYRVIGRSEEEE